MSAYVWFSEELWPGGYNFFIMLQNNPIVKRFISEETPYSIPKENLSKPQKIVVTGGSHRSVYYNSDTSFDDINTVTSVFINSVLKDESIVTNRTVAEKAEWFNVLRNDEILDTNSIYVDFSLACTNSLFSHMMGVENTWLAGEVSTLKEFIIAPVGRDNSDVLFYVRDSSNDLIYKYLISYAQKKDVLSVIDKYTGNTSATYSYAFELNLDKNDEGIGSGVKQKVFMDSMSIISSNSTYVPVISSQNVLKTDEIDKAELLSCFDYASRSPRHYTDYSGIEHYIENYSQLKIHPEGLLEYSVDVSGGGIRLPQNPTSVYETVNKCIEFSENVWHSVMPGEAFSVLVTSDLIESSDGVYNFTLDYYHSGNPVTTTLEGAEFEPMNHAVEIEVKNGEITKYRHFFRKYEQTHTVICPSQIESLDTIYEKLAGQEDETYIADVYLSYIENGNSGEKMPVWCAKTEGSKKIIY